MSRARRPQLFAALLVAFACLPAGVSAQTPLFLVNNDTRIAGVEYVFPEGRTFPMDRISQEASVRDPGGLARARRALSWLPFLSSPAPIPFSPLELQKDVVRLRQFYARMGFPRAVVSYDVQLDTIDNAVDVQLSVTEGPPLVLDTVVVSDPVGGDIGPTLPAELRPVWERLLRQTVSDAVGSRIGQPERQSLRSEPLRWVRDWGFAFATVDDELAVDSTQSVASLRITLNTGPRALVDSIHFEGNRALSESTLVRELPFRPLDWYSESRVAEGQRQIFGLELVRLALADIPDGQPEDSTVTVRYRIDEGRLRLLSGETGYSSVSGLRALATWTHRDFTGRARTLRTTVEARTGWLPLEGNTDRTFGASAALRQPYLFDRRVSGSLAPFVEYRDGVIDRSWSYGSVASVLWERGPLATVTLDYRLSRREVLEIRAGVDALENVDFIDALAALDSLESGTGSAVLGLHTRHGRVDNPLNPRQGWILSTSLQVAGPAALSATEYTRGEADVVGFFKVGRRSALTVRGGAGLLRPFGISAPTPQSDTLAQLVRLRDAMLTAGGTQSVRGWGNGLVGPKVPNFRLIPSGDTVVVEADRYVPFAGLARISTSFELRLPMPFTESDNSTFVFLDGAKVWNPDTRFGGGSPDPLGQERFFWGTGAGVSIETLAGAVRISAGYKLNPSPLDLRDAALVAVALGEGRPIDSVPAANLRRFHLHLSIGRGL